MYEIAMKAIAKQRVALEVMSYHAIAPLEEAEKLMVFLSKCNCDLPSGKCSP